MSIVERKELRLKLLRDLYDWHFGNEGEHKTVRADDIMVDREETILAYWYLSQKALITFRCTGGPCYEAAITAHGIDTIEAE